MTTSRHNMKGKFEVDPEVILKKKFRSKCRFRAIARLALENAYWLNEETKQYEGLDDVRKRVAQVLRGKGKNKQLLKLTDKAILNKPAKDRTDNEKKYLYRIIGGLKCFKRYPKHVKKKLAAATYFQYIKPGHVIVRQDQEAHAMYFIVTGDVAVSRMVFDELLNKFIPVDVGIMHSGDLFGDVSLLHNIPRTATCTTLSHCELLMLRKKDFKNILQASIQASWDEVRRVMSLFNYFDALDEVALREGCIMAKMISYSQNDIILGDGVGVPNHVYFIVSGSCQMVESLQISSIDVSGRTFYKLFDPHVERAESEKDMHEKYFGSLKHAKSKSSIFLDHTSLMNANATGLTSLGEVPSHSKISRQSIFEINKCGIHNKESNDKPEGIQDSQHKVETVFRLEDPILKSQDHIRESVRFSTSAKIPEIISNLRTYFIQVCQFNPGSTFGLGENMRDRRIVALTSVDCMLMPTFWLLEHNIANIWSRIKHFLDIKIPNKKQLFEALVIERQWLKYRDELVEDVVLRSNVVNWTSVNDVPYSIRLEEMIDV